MTRESTNSSNTQLETPMSQLNVGNIDRMLRIVLGLILIGLAGLGTLGPWAYLGVVPLMTGVFALCPVYKLLGIRTTSR